MVSGPVVGDPRSSTTAVSPLSIDAVQVAVTSASASSNSLIPHPAAAPRSSCPRPRCARHPPVSCCLTLSVGVDGVPSTAVPLMAMRSGTPTPRVLDQLPLIGAVSTCTKKMAVCDTPPGCGHRILVSRVRGAPTLRVEVINPCCRSSQHHRIGRVFRERESVIRRGGEGHRSHRKTVGRREIRAGRCGKPAGVGLAHTSP